MKILILGASGYIGEHLTERLAADHEVSVLARNHLTFSSPVECIVDKTLLLSLPKSALGKEVLINLIGTTSGAHEQSHHEVNVALQKKILEAIEKSPIRRVIYTSTLLVSSDATNPYITSKREAESLYRSFSQKTKTSTVILRLSNVYGPGLTKGVVGVFAQRAWKGEPVTIFGEKTERDFLFIDDAVDALARSISASFPSLFETVDICTGKPIRLKELLDTITHVLGKKADVILAPPRPHEPEKILCQPELARAVLGWHAKTTLPESIRRTL